MQLHTKIHRLLNTSAYFLFGPGFKLYCRNHNNKKDLNKQEYFIQMTGTCLCFSFDLTFNFQHIN